MFALEFLPINYYILHKFYKIINDLKDENPIVCSIYKEIPNYSNELTQHLLSSICHKLKKSLTGTFKPI